MEYLNQWRIKLLVCLLLLFSSAIYSQQLISTSGSHSQSGAYQISWTLGETVSETLSNGEMILTQGIHQYYVVPSGIINNKDLSVSIKVFPNPVVESICISILHLQGHNLEYNLNKLSIYLFDNTGRLLTIVKVKNKNTWINMQNYPAGQYLLKLVSYSNKEIQSFKILKK